MILRLLSETESALDRIIDSLLPVMASIAWIVSIRLVNRWIPKDKNSNDEVDDSEERPDLPMD